MTAQDLSIGVFVRPCAGEIVSGDTALIVPQESGTFLAIADVLGHGPGAGALADEIAEVLRGHAGPGLVELLGLLHRRLKGTLGAAVAVAYLENASGRLRYAGVGNTRLRRFGSADTRLVSRDGTVGQHMPTAREQSLLLRPGDLLLLTSDGVKESFGVEDYPGLLGDSPAVVARLVVQRFGKDYDDAICLALRYQP